MDFKIKIFLLITLTKVSLAFPSVSNTSSFVVAPNLDNYERIIRSAKEGEESSNDNLPKLPKIYEMRVDSNVTNRYATTLVTSKVKNPAQKAQQTVFAIILPEKAFISKFVMVIDGKDYESYVKEKQEAKQIYDQAVRSGLGAAHVALSARDSNRFTVSVNIEPEKKAIFYLTYEQLLEREDNKYELVINIHPKQPVKDLFVSVNINESLPLAFVRAPSIRSGNDISQHEGDLDPRADIDIINSTSAHVYFNPSVERQKELAATLNTNVDEGLSGQFIVQYDVERDQNGGEVLLEDGYFIHFFAPDKIEPLPKYVLFVLDTSGSMYGTKIAQLKTAMNKILSELKPNDLFQLIDFNSRVKVLNLDDINKSIQYPDREPLYFGSPETTEQDLFEKTFPGSIEVNEDNVKKAHNVIESMEANGGTNIGDALKVALHLVDVEKRANPTPDAPQPLIIFLTDGDATVGITDSNKLISRTSEQNVFQVPIFSLSFGDGADRALLQKLSLKNSGFSRHIYDAADASLQLQDFYKYISSPIMSNVTFKYVSDAKDVTKTTFPILFGGSELVVAGTLDKDFPSPPTVHGWGVNGPIDFIPQIKKPVTKLERMWAYLTIQQLLEESEIADDKKEIEKKALDIALKYSFVTPVSSLVVVKPNATDNVEPVAADKGRPLPEPSALQSSFLLSGMRGPPSYNKLSLNAYMGSYDSVLPEAIQTASMTYAPFTQNFLNNLDLTTTLFTSITPTTTQSPSTTTRTTPRPIVNNINTVEELKEQLPWLNETLAQDNVITTEKGTYPLALNETSDDNVKCPVTPKSGTGYCKLLHECPQVLYLLTNVHIFQQYYCEMRGLAAVCCPPEIPVAS